MTTPAQFRAVLAQAPAARSAHFALHRLSLADAAHMRAPGRPVPQASAQPVPLPVPGDQADAAAQPQPVPPLFAGAADAWIGVLLPKRWARRAVTRNTLRRQIYAMSREFAASLSQTACVVRLRAAISREQFVSATSDALRHAIRQELQTLMERGLKA